MSRRAAEPSSMSEGQREVLERLAASRTASVREAERARVLLLAADGIANTQIAAEVGVTPVTVRSWRGRFTEQGLTKFGKVAPGRGRPAQIPQAKVDEIVELTRSSRPQGQTQNTAAST